MPKLKLSASELICDILFATIIVGILIRNLFEKLFYNDRVLKLLNDVYIMYGDSDFYNPAKNKQVLLGILYITLTIFTLLPLISMILNLFMAFYKTNNFELILTMVSHHFLYIVSFTPVTPMLIVFWIFSFCLNSVHLKILHVTDVLSQNSSNIDWMSLVQIINDISIYYSKLHNLINKIIDHYALHMILVLIFSLNNFAYFLFKIVGIVVKIFVHITFADTWLEGILRFNDICYLLSFIVMITVTADYLIVEFIRISFDLHHIFVLLNDRHLDHRLEQSVSNFIYSQVKIINTICAFVKG